MWQENLKIGGEDVSRIVNKILLQRIRTFLNIELQQL
jgi:hypothetical protein